MKISRRRRTLREARHPEQLRETGEKPLAGFLVGMRRDGASTAEAQQHLDELIQLSQTYGLPVLASEMVTVRLPNASLLVGEGKVHQIKNYAEAAGADVIVIDDELSPSQQRNWEKLTGLAVIDRREVILGIFADRAQTREARLQVQLARAEYSLPRLTRAWTHLERQRGGGGLRGGAGEAQLEVDRRLLRAQVQKLKRELEHVRRVRSTQRKGRLDVPLPTAALVGYTNAGKSSLLNVLTGAGVLEEDKLFATLDPTTRKLDLPNGRAILLTDTVGFIRKLPHTLVEAFKATLEEAQLAAMLVHVLDASQPTALVQRRSTEQVLEELNALQKPTILALNKIDLMEDRSALEELREGYEHVVEVSTRTGEGLDVLARLMGELAGYDTKEVELRLPASRYDLIAMLHREGKVQQTLYDGNHAIVKAEVPTRVANQLAEFAEKDGSAPMPSKPRRKKASSPKHKAPKEKRRF